MLIRKKTNHIVCPHLEKSTKSQERPRIIIHENICILHSYALKCILKCRENIKFIAITSQLSNAV